MPKVIAKAEIHRTIKPGKAATATSPAVKPEIEIIAPGTAFVAEGEELAALRRARAVRDPEGPTATAVPSALVEDAPAPATKGKAKKATNTRTRATSKPKNAPADSENKTSDKDEDAGGDTENDADNGAGDGNEGDAADTDLV